MRVDGSYCLTPRYISFSGKSRQDLVQPGPVPIILVHAHDSCTVNYDRDAHSAEIKIFDDIFRIRKYYERRAAEPKIDRRLLDIRNGAVNIIHSIEPYVRESGYLDIYDIIHMVPAYGAPHGEIQNGALYAGGRYD